MTMSVSLFVCLSAREHISGTTQPIFTQKISVRVTQGGYIFYAGGSIAGVSCRRRWPPPTTLALTTLVA